MTSEGAESRNRGGGSAAFYSREAFGERLGGFIYGTIVVISAVIAGAKIYPDDPGRVAAFVIVPTFVLWLAHVYAHGLAQSVSHDRHLSRADLGHVARREASILEAGVPPVAALVLGAAGILSEDVAVWLAIGLGLGVLAVQGIVFARVERLGWAASAVVVTLNVGLGVLLVWLKVLLFDNH
jgi:hypothetical protein